MRMCAACGQYACDLTTHAHQDILLFRVHSCFDTSSEHRYSEYFQKSSETIGR